MLLDASLPHHRDRVLSRHLSTLLGVSLGRESVEELLAPRQKRSRVEQREVCGEINSEPPSHQATPSTALIGLSVTQNVWMD